MAANPRRVVFFVGAGVSRACGYPLTNEILPLILEGLDGDAFKDNLIAEQAPQLYRFLKRLMPGGRRAGVPPITEILSIIDHCLDNGQELLSQGAKNAIKLRDARWLLERAIARVIGKIHKREIKPKDIVDWILQQQGRSQRVSIISTNYDVSLDRALFNYVLGDWNKTYWNTDFGFTWRDPDDGTLVPPVSNPLLSLYKLHGSLNWLSCHRCGHTYINFWGNVSREADRNGIHSKCHCDFVPLRSVLVAPSFVRQYRDGNILSIWRSSVEALRTADSWVFAGYSLPAEDVGIRVLLRRALLARSRPPEVKVVSRSGDAEPQYRQLFPHCEYTADGMKAFLDRTCRWRGPAVSPRSRRKN